MLNTTHIVVFCAAVGLLVFVLQYREDKEFDHAVDNWERLDQLINELSGDPSMTKDRWLELMPKLEDADKLILDLGGAHFIQYPSLAIKAKSLIK